MFFSYFKTALRNLLRNKGYVAINIAGLVVGIAACMLIFLVIRYETSFDNFHHKRNQIYRLGTGLHSQDGIVYSAGCVFPAGPQIRIDFPQVREVASIFQNSGQVTIVTGGQEQKFNEENFFYSEPEFFSMFDFGWLSGNAESCLKDPASAVLTQAMAEKYFGDWKTAIGKTFKFNNKTVYKICGILKNIPANSDFPLAIVVSYSALRNTFIKDNLKDWVSTFSDAYTFVVLPPDLPVTKFNGQLRAFAKKYKPPEYAADAPIAQPLGDLHSDNRFGNFSGHTFSRSLINALSLIGLFLIVIASVNFVNLATAQAANRSKEVGIRKVLGSNRKQLGMQFLGETFLVTLVATGLALCLAIVLLPFLNRLLDLRMAVSFDSDPLLFFFVAIILAAVTLLSGTYPAIVLSRFNPITALKSRITARMAGGLSLRRILVVLQFVIAQILIIGMLIVVGQMNYFRTASLGFDKASVVNVPFPGDSVSRTKMEFVRDELLDNPDIRNVSFSFASPASEDNWNSDFTYERAAKKTDFSANLKWADASYFKTYGLLFLAGRPYYVSDTIREFVVNETLLKKLGVRRPQDALGKEISLWNGRKVARIVGVIKDFNCFSLKRPMAAVILSTWKDIYQTINIKMRPASEKASLAYIKRLWSTAFPDYAYEYHFLDDTISNFYKQENQLSILYKVFAALAIFISCLGLHGLVSFMAVQRTKEVGIRKVLGASVRHIIYLFSKEFTLLILVAFVISAPIAYFIMHGWLLDYSYRIDLGVSIFLTAVAGSVCIAWIAVGYRALRAALTNPVNTLRSE
ncbi:MAG TPA: ABC transporter permease [Puia sp.]|nr:ABC transporter permease [Puia sp.]